MDVCECIPASMICACRAIRVSTKPCGLTSATSWSIWVSNVRSTEKAFPNSNVFGEAPSGCLTELLSARSVVNSTQDQFSTFPTLNRMFRIWRFTTLFARSTISFSSLNYGLVVWCAIPASWWKCDSMSLTKCDRKFAMSSSGAAIMRQQWLLR